MLHAALLAATLIVPVAVDRGGMEFQPRSLMSAEQKAAAVRPVVSSATECIARTVSADPRFNASPTGTAFNSLIVESVPSCAEILRSMIDAYDRIYGDGEGEAFFMGPYLDSLPEAVTRRVKSAR